jgi:hypothetical protein
MVRVFLIVALSFAGAVSNATVVEPRELDDLVKESAFVGTVWIEQSTALGDGPASSYPACGASYRARTVDALKGKAGVVNFYASEDLVVGREYLVLLAQGLKSTTDVVSTTSLAGATPRSKRQWMADCTARYPGTWSVNGSEAPLLDRRMKIVVPGHSNDRWVAQRFYLVRFDKLPQFDTDKIGAPWSMGPSPYPPGIYLSWESLRTLLIQAASQTTPNTSLERTRER